MSEIGIVYNLPRRRGRSSPIFFSSFPPTAELGPMLSIWSFISSDLWERRTSTGSGLFALQGRDIEHILGQIVSIRVKTLSSNS